MKSVNRTQIEKFNGKYSKLMKDQEDIVLAQLEKKQRLLDTLKPYAIDGDEELAKLGNIDIQEAACVFSYAGIQAFSKMFGNSVSGIFRDEIVGMVRDVVRQEVRSATSDMFKGLIRGQYKALEEEMLGLVKNLSSEEQIAPTKEAEAPESVLAPVVNQMTPIKSIDPKTNRAQHVDNKLVASMIQSFNGQSIKLSDLKELLPEVQFYHTRMKAVMSFDSKVVKSGFGLYAYNMEE
jgi:hypothetical protein